MKVLILAGGYGTRLSEETSAIPKPMIEIGGQPILWHVMKHFLSYGHNEFIICAGYKGQIIKEYFANYFLHRSDITFDFTSADSMMVHNSVTEPWKVTVVDTGLNTMTGGRIKRVKEYLNNETFFMTYGDGVSDVNLNKLLNYHKRQKMLATLTAIQPVGRYGILDIDGEGKVKRFAEKHKEDSDWINGGFMVLSPEVLDYIDSDATVFEKEPLEALTKGNNLNAYKHHGFWQCMDTIRDKAYLEDLIAKGKAPWMVWNDD